MSGRQFAGQNQSPAESEDVRREKCCRGKCPPESGGRTTLSKSVRGEEVSAVASAGIICESRTTDKYVIDLCLVTYHTSTFNASYLSYKFKDLRWNNNNSVE